MISYEIKSKVKEKSISLENYGVNSLAWSKEDAQHLINSILKDKIGILGGDVFQIAENRLRPLPDNWSCEPNGNESEEAYYNRSKMESLEYISKYPVLSEETIVFAIIFTEDIG